MCNLYSMTANVDQMRRLFGPFRGDTSNLPPFDDIYPGRQAPVLRRDGGELVLELMTWGFPGPQAAGGRPVTNVRNLASPFWRSALKDPARRCLVPVTRFCEWTAEPDPDTKRKRKIWFGHRDQPLFAFAGIWRPGDDGSFMAFLTCEPNE
ncbi:MAG TPA: SOS response-associated peptidase family protein, partial [Sphingomicrobium sp.]|nr:SOS response-associated peptidase family protein [Sphingomicrobium sp.]